MTEIDNPPAFPFEIVRHVNSDNGGYAERFSNAGMSLRDYFAAAALRGILAREDSPAERDPKSEVAENCYFYADAMLAARSPS